VDLAFNIVKWQCCGSGKFIPDPDFLLIPDPGFRIPDPKTSTKERGKKKFVVIPFFVATNFKKIENYFIFEMLKEKILPSSQRIVELLPNNLSLSSKKYRLGIGIRDPGSGSPTLKNGVKNHETVTLSDNEFKQESLV
jgi:hypothetical protein